MAKDKPILSTAPALVGDKIYIRPTTAEDLANTFHWLLLSDPWSRTCRPIPYKTAAEAAEGYRKRESSPYEQSFMVIRKKDSVPVGRVSFFDFNTQNRSTELGLIIDPDEQEKGYGLAALRLLCRHLFITRGLNKVHAQTGAFNTAAQALMKKAGFKLDGTLRHHYFYKGEYHDGLVYSLLAYEFGD
ncbi:MAG: GNAT family N-acetyltransferase [Proteobacteria bacterium]|nr:GNAT family N-acetyltransferase [Pseudomonadota bacterium]